jgi:hypothetical protein
VAGPRPIPSERLSRLRAGAQLLHRPASVTDPAEIAARIGGVQDQDQNAGRLSFRARGRGLTAADVDRARTEERSLLRAWVMRKTVHLVATEDAGWLLPLYEERFEREARRRLGQLGLDARGQERGLRLLRAELERDAPLTRRELSGRLASRGLELDSSQWLHLVHLSTVTGIACFGPDQGARTCLVAREDWLGEPPPHDRDRALAELARRYIRAFGPAGERDLAYWSGLPIGEVRRGLEAIAPELEEVSALGAPAWVLRGAKPRAPARGTLRLLPDFDTYMLGYRSREAALPLELNSRINSGGGLISATIVLDGRVIGTWKARRPAGSLRISLEHFGRSDAQVAEAIEAEVADIERFTGRRVSRG